MHNNLNYLPDCNEKDALCHCHIDARLLKDYSKEVLEQILFRINKYNEKQSNIAVDVLFMKYLKEFSFTDDIKAYIENINIDSQYKFALAYFGNSKFRTETKNIINNITNNDDVIYNGIKISKVIVYYILKYIKKTISKEITLKIQPNRFEQYYPKVNNLLKDNVSKIYENFLKNPNEYFDLEFWTNVCIYKLINNNTIDVKGNPFLFNAAACLCYKNPLIRVIYNIRELKFPENISLELIKLIRYQISLEKLLTIRNVSIETKNMCSLVYLLVLEQTKLQDLKNLKEKMTPKSYLILCSIYSNYTNENSNYDIYNYLYSNVNFNNTDDFINYALFASIYKNKLTNLVNENTDILYIKQFDKGSADSIIIYAIVKNYIMKGRNVNNYMKIVEKYKIDFLVFIKKAIKILSGETKLKAIDLYLKFEKSPSMEIYIVISYIQMENYTKAKNKLLSLNITDDLLEMIYDEKNLKEILNLVERLKYNDALNILEKFNLLDKLSLEDKLRLYYNFSERSYTKLTIDRKNLLSDSIKQYKKECMKNKYIRINYSEEKGIDDGGLSKDWFTNVSNEIIKSGFLIPTPNSTSLTFNSEKANDELIYFLGQFLGSALISRRFINIKLTSFIWKSILDEKITLDDMEDYDSELYQSLKWIEGNNPEDLMMTFINSNEEELCSGGSNIELTEENKNKYIELLISKKLINKNTKNIQNIVNGFNNVIDNKLIKIFDSKSLKRIINGNDIIDIHDWEQNTIYNSYDENHAKYFFDVIGKWDQEKLIKLLKFATGLSVVPVNGFKGFENIGGKFKIKFIKNSENLPISHTCYNTIDLPLYETKKKLEKKLLWAIESSSFELY